MKALLVMLVHFRHGRDLAGRKAHTWGKPFNERVGHDCDGLLNSRTLAITWPQGVHGDVESLMAAAQVNGGVRRLPQQLEPLLEQFQSTR